MHLSDIQPGQSARIVSLGALDAPIRRKLMAMGLLPCSEVRFIRNAPLVIRYKFPQGVSRSRYSAHWLCRSR